MPMVIVAGIAISITLCGAACFPSSVTNGGWATFIAALVPLLVYLSVGLVADDECWRYMQLRLFLLDRQPVGITTPTRNCSPVPRSAAILAACPPRSTPS